MQLLERVREGPNNSSLITLSTKKKTNKLQLKRTLFIIEIIRNRLGSQVGQDSTTYQVTHSVGFQDLSIGRSRFHCNLEAGSLINFAQKIFLIIFNIAFPAFSAGHFLQKYVQLFFLTHLQCCRYRGGSRIFFRRGCTRLLLYFNTNKPLFLQKTSCIRKPQVISGGGGGGGAPRPPPPHPLHPPPRSAPAVIKYCV